MFTATTNDTNGILAVKWNAIVHLQNLRVAQNTIERRAQLVTHARYKPALGQIGCVGSVFRALQFTVGKLVRVDFGQE